MKFTIKFPIIAEVVDCYETEGVLKQFGVKNLKWKMLEDVIVDHNGFWDTVCYAIFYIGKQTPEFKKMIKEHRARARASNDAYEAALDERQKKREEACRYCGSTQ